MKFSSSLGKMTLGQDGGCGELVYHFELCKRTDINTIATAITTATSIPQPNYTTMQKRKIQLCDTDKTGEMSSGHCR